MKIIQLAHRTIGELLEEIFSITSKKKIDTNDRRVLYALACAMKNLYEADVPKWIPCEERMPEEHEWLGTKKFGTTMSDEVYVTFENSKGERFTKHLHFHNGELSSYDQFHMDTWYKGSKPIAWMPLPEPYKSNNE